MKLRALILTTMMAFGMMAANAQVDSVKKYQKVEELFKLLNMEEECLKAAKRSAEQTIANMPALADKKEAVTGFFVKYLSYAQLKNDLIMVYTKHYTTEEIGDLITFYKTPAGKKFSMVTQSIAAETMETYSKHLGAHGEELGQIANSPAK